MRKSILATFVISALSTVSNPAMADLEKKPLVAKEVNQPVKVNIIEGLTSIKSRDNATYEQQLADIESIKSELSACAGDAICEVGSVDMLINSLGDFSNHLNLLSHDYTVINNETIEPEVVSQKAGFKKGFSGLKGDVTALYETKVKLDELAKLKDNLTEDDKIEVAQMQSDLDVGKAKFMSDFNKLVSTRAYVKGLERLVEINQHRARQTKFDSINELGRAKILAYKKDSVIAGLQAQSFNSKHLFAIVSTTVSNLDLTIPSIKHSDIPGAHNELDPLSISVSFTEGDDFFQQVPEMMKKLHE